jgi:hypothetical protein
MTCSSRRYSRVLGPVPAIVIAGLDALEGALRAA